MRPNRFYTAAQVGEFDRRASAEAGLSGRALMERAGAAAYRLLRLRWPRARRLIVYCGTGNNGGDGLVVARLARAGGLDVKVGLSGAAERLHGAAGEAWQAWCAADATAVDLDALDPGGADVVVDALLGTGLDREVRGAIGAAITALNAAPAPVLALDIPSGLHADTGAVLGEAVTAAATITFIGAKRGLYTGAAPDHTGPIFLDTLAVPPTIRRDSDPAIDAIERAEVTAALPQPRPGDHKGKAGRLLIIGGELGFAGAPRLAAEAALASGVGLVTVVTRREHAAALSAARPEIMAQGLDNPGAALPALLEAADAVVLGPGLGRDAWGRGALAAVRAGAHARLLLDADALNLLAAGEQASPAPAVITPHPGEAGRLLGRSAGQVQADRFDALAALRAQIGGAVVLKGAGTVVAGETGAGALLPEAIPALAVGGTGDVLSGVIGALLGQGVEPTAAARCGVWLQAAAARRVLRAQGACRLQPVELLPALATLRDHPGDG